MAKRIMCLMICIVMVMSVFAACASMPAKTQADTPSSSPSSTDTPSSSPSSTDTPSSSPSSTGTPSNGTSIPGESKNTDIDETGADNSGSSSDVSFDSDWGVSDDDGWDNSDDVDYSRLPIPENLVNTGSSKPNNEIEGLLDASIVGIDKEKFLHEVKYPVPTKVDYIINAVDYGVKPNDKKDDTRALQAAIAEAGKKAPDKVKKIVLPAGDLDFVEGFNAIDYRYGIIIDGIDNLVIEGQNTTLYFHNGSLGFKGIHITNCNNFLFTKINVDWSKLPFSSGVLESFDETGRTAVVRVNKGYIVNANTEVIEYLEYDSETNLPRDGGNFLYNHNEVKNIKRVEYLGDNKLKLYFGTAVSKAPAGTKVALAHAMNFSESFIIERSSNVKFETVNLYSSPGMGLRAYSNTNLYFNRFNCVLKPGTDRLLTATADILHLKNTAGEVVVTNSTLENSHDDAVNIGGHYSRIVEISGSRLRIISPLGMWGTFKPAVGDIYEISDISTLEVKKTITVTKVEDSNDGYWITIKEDVDGLMLNNALANITRTPKFIFKNNLVRNKRNRGILVQTRNVLIENNAFSNVMNGAIQLLSEVNIFNESTAPRDVTIRNNKFISNNQGADADISIAAYGSGFSVGSPNTIRNITIENNFMAYSKNAALAFKGASNLTVRGNLIYNPATNPVEGKTNSAILLENVRDLKLDGNKIFGGTAFGFRTVFVSGGVDASTIALTGNISINQQDVYGEEKIVEIGKANASINLNDNSIDEWANVGTNIEMNACTNINVSEVKISDVKADDFKQTTKFLWKDDGIYFSFDVTDSSLQFNPNKWWLGDGLELFVTTETKSYANTGTVKLTNEDTLQLFMKTQVSGGVVFFEERTSAAVLAKKDQFKLNFWTESKGYKGEGFIPFTAMPGVKAAILAGKPIAISVNFGDSDAGNEELNPMDKFMTFSTVRHPTAENKMIPANMTKFMFKN